MLQHSASAEKLERVRKMSFERTFGKWSVGYEEGESRLSLRRQDASVEMSVGLTMSVGDQSWSVKEPMDAAIIRKRFSRIGNPPIRTHCSTIGGDMAMNETTVTAKKTADESHRWQSFSKAYYMFTFAY